MREKFVGNVRGLLWEEFSEGDFSRAKCLGNSLRGMSEEKFSGEFFTEEMSGVECKRGIVRGGPYPHIGLQVSKCNGCDLGYSG